ncbi:MAG: hypothetical protein HQL86_08035 [Magnetococcales bacterium]|nr:hypothetical protein [Magnetococcales bacterium]
MTQESLVFTIGVDPGSIATGMAKARDLLTGSLKAMGTAAQREVKWTQSSRQFHTQDKL